MRSSICLSLLLTLLLVNPTASHAGGFTIPLIGSRGSTIGGFGALADDTSAMYHNVAGLGFMDDFNVDLSGTGIFSHTNYWRCTAAFDANGKPIPGGCATDSKGNIQFENQVTTVPHKGFPAGFGILPYLGLTGRFGLKRWNFGLAVYSPHNATGAFNDCERKASGEPVDCKNAPQRFHAQLGTINTIFITPSVAFTPHPDVSVGLGVSAVRASIISKRALWVGGPDSSLTTMMGDDGWQGEGTMTLDASAWSMSFNLGAIWKIGRTLFKSNRWLRGMRIGLSFVNQTSITFDSDITFHSPLLHKLMTENDGCRKGDAKSSEVLCGSSVGFTFPLLIRPSFFWQINDQFSFGFDIHWQNYSVYEEIKVDFDAPLVLLSVKVEENVEPKNSTDSITLSMGGRYTPRWAPGLEFHLGFVFDQSPYPNSTYSLLSPDADKYGPVFGASYQFDFGLQLSAGYIPMFYQDRTVRDSVLQTRICKPDDTSCQKIAPNAKFSMNGDVRDKRVDLFTFQIGWRFGYNNPAARAATAPKEPRIELAPGPETQPVAAPRSQPAPATQPQSAPATQPQAAPTSQPQAAPATQPTP